MSDSRDDAKKGRSRGRESPRVPKDDAVPKTLGAEGSQLLSAPGDLRRISATIEEGRAAPSPPRMTKPESARRTWSDDAKLPAPTGPRLAQTISLTETAIQAMPSSSRDLFVVHDRDGAFASAIRILSTRVETMKRSEGKKSFLVTSVSEGEGKTVLATNLALAMSEDSERRVALLDANFRSPRAGELFNLDGRRGLLAALSGERPLSQCIARVLGRNLIVLHAGGHHKNPASVLGAAKFKSLLAELSDAVDYLIVDAPPALPYADVPLLAQSLDGVLMVIAENRTRRGPLDRALDTIGRGRIAGHVYFEHVPQVRKRRR